MFDLYQNIKKYRIELGLTQTQLAEKAGYADKTMISKIESGKVDLTFSKIKVFADILNLTPSQLIGNEDSIRAIREKEKSNMKTALIMENALLKLEDEVESVKEDICKYICKWPEQINDNYELLTEHCEDCPLERL